MIGLKDYDESLSVRSPFTSCPDTFQELNFFSHIYHSITYLKDFLLIS